MTRMWGTMALRETDPNMEGSIESTTSPGAEVLSGFVTAQYPSIDGGREVHQNWRFGTLSVEV